MGQKSPQKWLRIGVIQGGRIVQERLIKAGLTVWVGSSPKCTFVLPEESLPRNEFPLFQWTGGMYELHLTDKMKGKVRAAGNMVQLKDLRTDPAVTRRGAVWRLPLSPLDRGKVCIGDVTVLFQFVNPPPAQPVKPLRAMDFRPRMVEEEDPVFLGFLAIWSALAVVFMVWVWNTDPSEITMDELPDRFTNLVLEGPEKPEVVVEDDPEPDPEIENPEAPPDAELDDAVADAHIDPPDRDHASDVKDPVAAAENREKTKDDLRSKYQIFTIGTTGDGEGSVLEGWGENDGPTMALAGIGPTKVEVAGPRDTRVKDLGPADIRDLEATGTGERIVIEDVDAIVVDIPIEDGEVLGNPADVGEFRDVVKRYRPHLKYCYETRLKKNPNLSGRVEIAWTVSGGRVADAYVVSNLTEDSALADCVVGRMALWRFPSSLDGQDVTWPFVFRPKKG
jgi:hypothetical protein